MPDNGPRTTSADGECAICQQAAPNWPAIKDCRAKRNPARASSCSTSQRATVAASAWDAGKFVKPNSCTAISPLSVSISRAHTRRIAAPSLLLPGKTISVPDAHSASGTRLPAFSVSRPGMSPGCPTGR
ncbi:hypothetical protein G6F59_017543 [Rhizopus arrhizus]|nr:hypothetical protein G6F59_017543 [Rhizopus arrhizus]